jgi:transposase
VAVDAANASEVAMGLAVLTMALVTLPRKPGKPIPVLGDRGYDCDDLRLRLKRRGLVLVAKHRSNRVKPRTSDPRRERRLKRRWKVERSNAWLHGYRRAVTRHEKSVNRFEGFVSLACAFIALGKIII